MGEGFNKGNEKTAISGIFSNFASGQLSTDKMEEFDRKAQMMDAGGARFILRGGYGTALGLVRHHMEEVGKVFPAQDSLPVPPSTGPYDLFVDLSSPWRRRYISCKVDDSGEAPEWKSEEGPSRHYSATFKQGDRSTPLRSTVFAICALALLGIALFGGAPFLVKLCLIVLALLVAYAWTAPSSLCIKAVRGLIDILDKATPDNAGNI